MKNSHLKGSPALIAVPLVCGLVSSHKTAGLSLIFRGESPGSPGVYYYRNGGLRVRLRGWVLIIFQKV